MVWLRFMFSNFVTFSPPLSKKIQKTCLNVYGEELSSRNVSKHTCLRSIFNRNLSQKRGQEMSSRKVSSKSLMGEGATKLETTD